jgi:uncharacterized protein YfaT (DUF1175 family)
MNLPTPIRGRGGIGILAVTLALVGLLLPVRLSARLEAAEGNPVQRIVVETRNVLGLRVHPWGLRVQGTPTWGDAAAGFFLSPVQPVALEIRAWPGLRTALMVAPQTSEGGASTFDQGDREAFRSWFVALVEDQLERLSPAWEPAQRDCAGLLRFAFREAWGPHTTAWKERLSYTGAFVARDPSLQLAGPWKSAFPTPEGWRPFAKGGYLRDFACVPISREPQEGRPGDLLFFSRPGARHTPDHAMTFGRPDPDGTPVLIYHTGAEGSATSREAGDMRRVRLTDLLQHPDPAFRPQPENPAFLGCYRWKVLAE